MFINLYLAVPAAGAAPAAPACPSPCCAGCIIFEIMNPPISNAHHYTFLSEPIRISLKSLALPVVLLQP